MPNIQLVTEDSRLQDSIQALQQAIETTAGIPQASDVLQIVVLPDFSSFAKSLQGDSATVSVFAKMYESTPGLYQKDQDKIFINERVFFMEEVYVQRSILAHETAHAIRHRAGVALAGSSDEEHRTDLLVCQLGYANDIIRERGRKSPERAEALALWENEEVAFAKLQRYQMRRNAYIVT